ncbi:hypothetical protein, conserved [Plasmodium gonderi]|uniref:Uncharacterized protein n=1 Tax=Plasmodium gonderi TaxID=77519 RepID=A0A1Y1JBB6_PLAGO|nr:hypothetical protein, conserved [Plasmodium gonderi]GAW79786.1 hypothetical protein, conserved [Plasmodium gonderi]
MDIKVLDDEIMLSDGRIIKIPVKHEDEKNEKEKEKGKIKVEKVPNVWGSSAGAGSDYFDLYRKQRNQENERLELLEKKWKEYTQNQIFQSKRREKIEYMEKKSLKKKTKRQIKKNKIREMRNNKKGKTIGISDMNKESMDPNQKHASSSLNCDTLKLEDLLCNPSSKKHQNYLSVHDEENLINSQNDESARVNDEKFCAPTVDTNNFLVLKEEEEELF